MPQFCEKSTSHLNVDNNVIVPTKSTTNRFPFCKFPQGSQICPHHLDSRPPNNKLEVEDIAVVVVDKILWASICCHHWRQADRQYFYVVLTTSVPLTCPFSLDGLLILFCLHQIYTCIHLFTKSFWYLVIFIFNLANVYQKACIA